MAYWTNASNICGAQAFEYRVGETVMTVPESELRAGRQVACRDGHVVARGGKPADRCEINRCHVAPKKP
jgi:hypothetical protein